LFTNALRHNYLNRITRNYPAPKQNEIQSLR